MIVKIISIIGTAIPAGLILLFIILFIFKRKFRWTILGRCSECGSKNVIVWSANKAECGDCGARNQ